MDWNLRIYMLNKKIQKHLEICDFILKQDSTQILIDPFFIKGIFYANMKQYPKAISAIRFLYSEGLENYGCLS